MPDVSAADAGAPPPCPPPGDGEGAAAPEAVGRAHVGRFHRVGVAASIVVAIEVGLGVASLYLFQDDVTIVALWALFAATGVVAFIAIAAPALAPVGRLVGALVVAVAVVPWAIGVHAALPHGWLDQARRDVLSLDVSGLAPTGAEQVTTTCTDYLDDVEHASYAAAFQAGDGADMLAARDRVDAAFSALGYRIDEPGQGRRGPLAYSWGPVNGTVVWVRVSVERCGPMDQFMAP